METHLEMIARMNAEMDRVLSPFVNQGPIAFLDFPDYPNVGDTAIWLGSMAFLAKRGLSPSFISTMSRVNVEAIRPQQTIYLQGGGNLGDVWSKYWPNPQEFREAVIERFPDKTIIQLPQSINFQSERNADRAARVFEKHPNFLLLVRDARSLEFARRKFQCRVALCPDMAFALGSVNKVGRSNGRTLFLLRTDIEKAQTSSLKQTSIPPNGDVADWIEEPRWTTAAAIGRALITSGVPQLVKGGRRRQWMMDFYKRKAELRFLRGITLLSAYDQIVSDRLHVHIVSSLLGIPHIVLDNNYGKISGIIDAFSTDWQGVRRASTLDEAIIMNGK
ncbi:MULTISPECIES: polysaccharide pyruvyl transferase family protein [unclassified Bradyrhizobium]|uniref:polysaccharide pyruvyl transferase family protein n=1 Tax=unclassified Bradyrhizobium TaxID=2631580 RepID=UPI001CD7B084|nr:MULTISPECIES: polysaccharide pyruvyl transferase family protein [unclassified Bradyrhizobium]MCA1495213.1 polysaccharide pyruvyl transferase family protein [Bradyrhizobium sp. NBAIM14]MCA1531021.1 polysaccharide pyruvyl transferase family protein [Bradyrhizobium sp. NBAIM03]